MNADDFARLTTFEQRILSFVFAIEAPHLLQAIRGLRVLERKVTGVGLFVDFGRPNPPTTKPDASLGNLAFAYNEGWNDVLRCAIAVGGGEVHFIELFSNHSNSFPDDLDCLKLGYMEVVPKVPPI